MMRQLFISHSYEDISLARFLIHLLNYYHIRTWTSFIDLEPNINSKQNIDKVQLSCDNLLVLITENTLTSSWVTSEILIFKNVKPSAEIIPLVFNKKINLDKIAPGLKQYQYIDFTQDLTSGFRSLFAKFGIDFLIHTERQHGNDRRKGEDRRKHHDRRSKDLTLRLHKTFLDLYLENSLITEEYDFELNNAHELKLFFESLKQGSKNYLCYDEIGNLYNTNYVINLCVNQAWTSLVNDSPLNNGRHVKAKYLTLAVAKEMTNRFTVKCKDRRNNHDRRSGDDRNKL